MPVGTLRMHGTLVKEYLKWQTVKLLIPIYTVHLKDINHYDSLITMHLLVFRMPGLCKGRN